MTLTAEQFNARHPVGTPVKYFPVLGQGRYVEAKTRSTAWTLGHGDAVVSVEGRAGGVALRNLEICETAPVPSR